MIHSAHIRIGHRERNKIVKEINDKYTNATIECNILSKFI